MSETVEVLSSDDEHPSLPGNSKSFKKNTDKVKEVVVIAEIIEDDISKPKPSKGEIDEVIAQEPSGAINEENAAKPKTPKRKIDEVVEQEPSNEIKEENAAKRHKSNGENSIPLEEEKENVSRTNNNLKTENENEPNQNSSSDNHLEEISTLFESSEVVIQFLHICYKKITATKLKNTFMDKLKLLKVKFDKIEDYIESEQFKNNTREKIVFCKTASLSQTLQKFVDLFNEIDITSKRAVLTTNGSNEKVVKRLESFLEQLHKKINELEQAEVNFDDEENSNYMKLQRYRDRAFKVYRKLCTYYKENVYSGDLTRSKVDFCNSEYTEINKAINKVFKDGTKFPNYYEMEKIVRKCVDEKKLNLSEYNIKSEAENCFRKLGKLLQRRRQLELYNMHTSYLTMNEEPNEDSDLIQKLNENKAKATEKISKICEEYVKLQEEGKEIEISSDSDDSDHVCSDEEDETKNDKKVDIV